MRAAGGMPTMPMVVPPSSRPTTEPSVPRTGTRRSSDSIAPIMNSASARALAVRLRTTSTWRALAGLEVDVLGAGADAADGAQHRREIEHLARRADRGRHDHGAHVVERPAQLARVEGELGRMAHPVARAQPFHHIGFEGIDDRADPCGMSSFACCARARVPEFCGAHEGL